MSRFLLSMFVLFIIVACGEASPGEVEGFQSRDQSGKRTYLFSHYEVLAEQSRAVRNPFQQAGKLTDAHLTITAEMLGGIGQCLYQVQSDRPLSAHTPAALREMLSKAQPLTQPQNYIPLDIVYDELKDFRDLYGHRMPWYYNYLAIGGALVVLNGLFDIATHDAQAEALKIAQKYLQSDAYRIDLASIFLADEDTFDTYTDARGRTYYTKINDPDKLEARLKGWLKDLHAFNRQQNEVIIKSGQAEHKLEQLFGRFIYAGREVKIFGRTVNLNPLWALKEKAGKKFVPLVQKGCKTTSSVMCICFITTAAGIVLGAAVPLTYFLTGKVNAFLHREQEQNRLLDIVGDWDNFRTFTVLTPADMKKLQQKMRKLSAPGTRDCPPSDTLVDHYLGQASGRFY